VNKILLCQRVCASVESAMPPDVRRGSAPLPKLSSFIGLRPLVRLMLNIDTLIKGGVARM